MKVKDLMTQAEAARLVGISRSSLNDAIRRGLLRTVDIAGTRLVSRGEVVKRWPDGPRQRGPASGTRRAKEGAL
jgi:predicted site-specific integrase-resolvase